ncbi:MAG: RNA 2',3'-cyclic phosphodiesterase [Promicromonosporaceae bacterium]|nr:RNA 2',3'-cyclic phosphodiesterase [Promicromonosporaceae bacterium]
MRLFTAIYPSYDALDHLDLALRFLGDNSGPGGPSSLRWVPREQRHITLAFHGQVPDGIVPDYLESLSRALSDNDDADVSCFSVTLAGGGSFNARTLWAGIGEGLDELRRLSQVVDRAASDVGIRGDNRAGSRPHLTLARLSANRGPDRRRAGNRGSKGTMTNGLGGPNVEALAHALAIYRGPSWPVESVRVVRSDLGEGRSGGPLHETVGEVSLSNVDFGGSQLVDESPFLRNWMAF